MVFTGLVQAIGQARFDRNTSILELRVESEGRGFSWERSVVGDSVAVNGVCLTLLHAPSIAPSALTTVQFFIMEETLTKTNLGALAGGDWVAVNVEHALRAGDSLGGHVVSGHVDGTATVWARNGRGDGSLDVWLELAAFPPEATHVIYKGSICLDGVSLTVAEVSGQRVRVSLIPHTQQVTILQHWQVGSRVNVEFDQNLKAQKAHNAATAVTSASPGSAWAQHQLDEHFMLEAIALGNKGRITAPPNPWVGSVIVREGQILGRGFHLKAGEGHAEVNAVADAIARGFEGRLAGATIYVTLEPCHHFGRTPPCDQLLVAKKFARVVVAVTDPDARVAGQGLAFLRSQGLQVLTGVCQAQAEESLAPYLFHRRTSRPYVVLKIAQTLDAKIACEDGTSQWITSEGSRTDAQRIRAESGAILVGANTAVTDKPRLTVRLPELSETAQPRPLRVILDSTGRVTDGPILDSAQGSTLVFTSDLVNAQVKSEWEKRGVQVETVPLAPNSSPERRTLDLTAVLASLGKRGILQVMIEGGAALASAVISAGLAQRLVLYQGPGLIGASGQPWLQAHLAPTVSQLKPLRLVQVRQIGNDIRADYEWPTQ